MKNIYKILLCFIAIGVLSLSLMACGDKYTISGSDSDQTLYVGDTYTTNMSIVNSKGQNQSASWTSSDESVVTVSGGVVTAKGVGRATVTITSLKDSSVSASFSVTVQAETLSYSAKDITTGDTLEVNDTMSIYLGDRVLFLVANQNGDSKTVTLETSDSGILSVSNNSLTASSIGTATLTINVGDTSKTVTVNIIEKKYTVTYIINTETVNTQYTLEFKEDEAINLEAQAIEGYQFNRWYYDQDFTQKVATNTYISEDITIYASYTQIITWSINYNTKGSVPSDAPTTYTNVDKTVTLLPTPTYYGHSFLGWYAKSDYSGNPVEEISLSCEGDVNLYAKWSSGVDLSQMTFSVMGDSVSSFKGEQPMEEWLYFYPLYSQNFTTNKVTESSQMWFHIIEKEAGLTLDTLNSAAGSSVDMCFDNTQAPSSDQAWRVQMLYKSAIKKPNIIIIWMGGNDLESAYQRPIEEFQECYEDMLDLICNKYCKKAYVFCCTLCYHTLKSNKDLDKWNQAIMDAATNYGCPIIRLDEAITKDNYSGLLGDAVHMNSEGQKVIAAQMLKDMKKAFDIE